MLYFLVTKRRRLSPVYTHPESVCEDTCSYFTEIYFKRMVKKKKKWNNRHKYSMYNLSLHRTEKKKSANHMHFTDQTNINQAHKALQITTNMKQKLIWRWFTQYRLLVNHDKYTFQYIIINTGKLNTSSRDAVSYRAFFNDTLAQFIGNIDPVDATDCLETVWEVAATQKSL